LRGFLLLTLRAVAVATGMLDAGLPPTVCALREAVSVGAALPVLDSAEDLAVCEGKVGITRKVLRGKGGKDGTQGGHDRRPCMRALRRS
jgi:hypothetical protein